MELFGTFMTFPEKLRWLMDREGLTQQSLGEELGLSHRAVGKWLASQSRPRAPQIKALAEHFGVPVINLTDDDLELPRRTSSHPALDDVPVGDQPTDEMLAAYHRRHPIPPEFEVYREGLRRGGEFGRLLFPDNEDKAMIVMDIYAQLSLMSDRLERIEKMLKSKR